VVLLAGNDQIAEAVLLVCGVWQFRPDAEAHAGGYQLTAGSMLTRQSCVGNTFHPTYVYKDIYNSNSKPMDLSLNEEKIALLQNAAHQAVANAYGADYVK